MINIQCKWTYRFIFVFCGNILLPETVSAERIVFITSYLRDRDNVGPRRHKKFVMGSRSRRQSQSRSRSRSRDRWNKSKRSRSRSPEKRRGRSRSVDKKRNASGRGRSGSEGSSDGSPGRRRPQLMSRPGSSSDSECDRRRRQHLSRNKSRGRSSG